MKIISALAVTALVPVAVLALASPASVKLNRISSVKSRPTIRGYAMYDGYPNWRPKKDGREMWISANKIYMIALTSDYFVFLFGDSAQPP